MLDLLEHTQRITSDIICKTPAENDPTALTLLINILEFTGRLESAMF